MVSVQPPTPIEHSPSEMTPVRLSPTERSPHASAPGSPTGSGRASDPESAPSGGRGTRAVPGGSDLTVYRVVVDEHSELTKQLIKDFAEQRNTALTAADLPRTVGQWREYLRGYSAEVLASDYLRLAVEEERASWLTEGRRAAGWLGFDPATEGEVLAAEQRLGVRFPPTYRNFLLASNG